MSYADFLHCMTPYNNHEYKNTAEEYLKENKPSILEFADCDQSGTVDFSEFYFFMSIMQIPQGTLRKEFKKANKKGVWTKDDLKKRLPDLMLKSASGSKIQEKTSVDARAVKVTKEDLLSDIAATSERIFAGKDEINFEDFIKMRQSLRDQLLHYEFHNFEPEDGTISLEQWLYSLIKSVRGSRRDKCRKQIKKIVAQFPDARVSYNEFVSFNYWLNELNWLRAQIEQYRYLDYDGFYHHINQFCEKNKRTSKIHGHISDVQIKAIFGVLDSDESGELEKEEILDVLQDPQMMGQSQDSKAKEEFMQWAQSRQNGLKKWIKDFFGFNLPF